MKAYKWSMSYELGSFHEQAPCIHFISRVSFA